jgi:hypothetical protein
MAAAKVDDRVVIGMEPGGDEAEGDAVVGRPLDGARGSDAGGVAREEQREEDGRMVGRGAVRPECVDDEDGREIELINNLNNEAGEVVFREQLVDAGREEGGLKSIGIEPVLHEGRPS